MTSQIKSPKEYFDGAPFSPKFH